MTRCADVDVYFSQEAQKILGILGNDFVNVAVDARQDGHFGTIPPEESWTLSDVNKSAFVYYCGTKTSGNEGNHFANIK